MTELRKGCFCEAVAGHDAGRIYIVLETDGNIYVSDGKYRTVEMPKKKNLKHIRLLNYTDADLEKKIAENRLRNEDIKYSIKKYLVHIRNVDKQEVSECQSQML